MRKCFREMLSFHLNFQCSFPWSASENSKRTGEIFFIYYIIFFSQCLEFILKILVIESYNFLLFCQFLETSIPVRGRVLMSVHHAKLCMIIKTNVFLTLWSNRSTEQTLSISLSSVSIIELVEDFSFLCHVETLTACIHPFTSF